MSCDLGSCSAREVFPSGLQGLVFTENSMYSLLVNLCQESVISTHGTGDNVCLSF